MGLVSGGNLNSVVFSLHHLSLATTLVPGQDKLGSSGPISEKSSVIVSCGVRSSEVGVSDIRKPQVVRSLCNTGSIIAQAINLVMTNKVGSLFALASGVSTIRFGHSGFDRNSFF